MTDFYDILGVSRLAPHKEVRRAYLRQCKLWHPDRIDAQLDPAGWERAHVRFKLISEAHTTLKESDSRRQYDKLWDAQYGSPNVERGAAPEATAYYPASSKYVQSRRPYNNLDRPTEVTAEDYLRRFSRVRGGFWKNYFLSLSLDNRIALGFMLIMTVYVLWRVISG